MAEAVYLRTIIREEGLLKRKTGEAIDVEEIEERFFNNMVGIPPRARDPRSRAGLELTDKEIGALWRKYDKDSELM